jgi:hypothetical protein
VSVQIEVSYMQVPEKRTNFLTFAIFFVFFLVSMFLFLFLRTKAMRQEEKEGKEKDQVEYHRKEVEQRKSMLIYKRTEQMFRNNSFLMKAREFRSQYKDTETNNLETEEGGNIDTVPSFNPNLNQTINSFYTETNPPESNEAEYRSKFLIEDDIRRILSENPLKKVT